MVQPTRRRVPAPMVPLARGPISEQVIDVLRGRRSASSVRCDAVSDVADPVGDDDLQLALYCLYELHYRGFAGVNERLEWDPGLLTVRKCIEARFEEALSPLGQRPDFVPDVAGALRQLIDEWKSPSLSSYAESHSTLEQMRELAVHRSAYQLKEADPHTWGIPRLAGRAKAALVEIQADEYGGGVETEMHSALFAETLSALDLDPEYGAYIDFIPGITLATVNLISLFGLHRRLRGELVGHLAVFEMTSVGPMGRYGGGLARLGVSPQGRRFYDVHVEADARHEVIAARDLAAGLAEAEPALPPRSSLERAP